ncbi:MAG: hypothetical protein JJD98_17150 [Polaromonas sp.]|nr:hypothetical protein [Polaromonas sp.]
MKPARARVEGKDVGHVVFGHVVNTEPKDMYLSRMAARASRRFLSGSDQEIGLKRCAINSASRPMQRGLRLFLRKKWRSAAPPRRFKV